MKNKLIRIYVPRSPRPWRDTALDTFARYFGGATAQESIGVWAGKDGQLCKEPVDIVWSFTDEETLALHEHGIITLAGVIKSDLEQEAVAVERDGVLLLL